MRFDPEEIREATNRDFEAAWLAGRRYASERAINERYPRSRLCVSSKRGK